MTDTTPPRNLRTEREALGLSRGQLAGLARCSPSYIQVLEDGYAPDKGAKRDAIWTAIDKARAEGSA